MPTENANGANAPKTPNYPVMSLTGGIQSRNIGEEFIRVDVLDKPGEYGEINRKTGFLPVAEGQSAKLIKAIAEGKRSVKLGSQTKNGVFNIALIDPSMQGVEVPAGAAASADLLLEHQA